MERKQRVHFHQLMLDVHDAMHRWRKESAGKSGKDDDDPISPLAADIAERAWLLCFDEFHVVDVADAMILGRLFTALFDLGVVVVATSNWSPDDLYKDGLQRDRFLPFIDLLKERLDILELDGGIDYRLERSEGDADLPSCPLGRPALAALEQAFHDLTDGAAGAPCTLDLKGRHLEIPRAAKGVAWFTFEELCDRPLGAADYLALATHYHTVIIAGVPVMSAAERNQAKRFMTLIDALYEHKANAVIAAEAPPQALYVKGTGAAEFHRTASRLDGDAVRRLSRGTASGVNLQCRRRTEVLTACHTTLSSRAEGVAIHSLGLQWIAASLSLLAMTPLAVELTATMPRGDKRAAVRPPCLPDQASAASGALPGDLPVAFGTFGRCTSASPLAAPLRPAAPSTSVMPPRLPLSRPISFSRASIKRRLAAIAQGRVDESARPDCRRRRRLPCRHCHWRGRRAVQPVHLDDLDAVDLLHRLDALLR